MEECVSSGLESGEKVRLGKAASDAIIDKLSMAGFVQELLDRGMSTTEALREGERRVRFILKGSEE
jgi:hypothetical protein